MAKNQKKKKEVVELTPPEKFAQLQTLKRATRCMLVEQDVYEVYLKLTKDFAELHEIGKEAPFEGSEQCQALSEECQKLAEEWKKTHQTERTVESRTVVTSARERDAQETKKKGKGKWIALALLLIIVAGVISYNVNVTKYPIAKLMEITGFDEWAKYTYESLGNYKDSQEHVLAIQKKMIRQTKKGQTVSFGKVSKPDANGNTVFENCDWVVLDKQGDLVLLAKDHAIQDIPYHVADENVTWENCALRQTLNTTFLEQTFTPLEQESILVTPVTCSDNPMYQTKGGNDSSDKVFIMNELEITKYQKYLKDRIKMMRLRTPGKEGDTTTYVSSLGMIDKKVDVIEYGFPVNRGGVSIRPAMWVDCK